MSSPTSQSDLAERLRTSTHAVWGYVRVSSDKQEEGQSPEAQEKAIREYAAAKNLGPVEFVVEAASAEHPAIAVSFSAAGLPTERQESPRPLFLMLLGYLAERQNAHLIVWKMDRFSRLGYEQEMILSLLWRRGATVHSTFASEQDALSKEKAADPMSTFFRQVLGAAAQYDRALIKIRTQMGYKMKASKGQWVGGGLPYGYDVDKNDLKVNEAEAHWVRVIFFLHYRCDEGPTRIGSILDKKFNQPGWYRQRVSRVLDNFPLYNGRYTDPFDVEHDRPDLQVIPDDWETWADANNITPETAYLSEKP